VKAALISAEPGNHVAAPKRRLQNSAGILNESIASVVAQLIVHGLQLVEVGIDQRAWYLLPPCDLEAAFCIQEKTPSVQHAGHHVGDRDAV
jgi:hypothetical protein